MEVKPGYKQTVVGVIPEEWQARELGGIVKSTQLGGNYQNSERETSWPLVKMGNLGRGSIKLDKLEFISGVRPPATKDRLRENDVLFNTRNTLDLVGKVAIWRNELPEAYFNSNIMRMEFEEQEVSSKPFMSAILNTPRLLKSLRGIATGTTSVAAIYCRDLVKIAIPLAPKDEQTAIAEALSDADALIESLEQLIAKKRHLKQGAMQELLTGKRRLPGFSGNWKTMKLADLAAFFSGGTPPTEVREYYDGNIPWITSGDLNRSYLSDVAGRISKSGLNNSAARMIQRNTLLLALYGATAGVTAISLMEGAINQAVLAIVPHSDSAMFLFFKLSHMKDLLISTYTQGGQPNLSGEIVKSIEFGIPGLPEQTAIASVLSDMDTEIEAFESRLAKARQIKQGMMQELLTGRIRLV